MIKKCPYHTQDNRYSENPAAFFTCLNDHIFVQLVKVDEVINPHFTDKPPAFEEGIQVDESEVDRSQSDSWKGNGHRKTVRQGEHCHYNGSQDLVEQSAQSHTENQGNAAHR